MRRALSLLVFRFYGREIDMNPLAVYTLNWIGRKLSQSANLDNERLHSPYLESEETMSVNKKKIRREVVLNGVKVWVTANSEQEYVNRVLQLSGATAGSSTKHLFRDYAENWFEVFSKSNIANVTALTYRRQLDNYILPVLGDMSLEDVSPADAQKVFNQMDENAKQETKNKVKIVLNQIFKMAVDDGLILRNPLQSSAVKIKGKAANVTEPYTVEQMRHLAAHIGEVKRDTDRAWLAISISLPLRPEEVLGLQWRDVDLENCIIRVHNTVTHPARNEPEFKPYTKTAASIRDLAFPPRDSGLSAKARKAGGICNRRRKADQLHPASRDSQAD